MMLKPYDECNARSDRRDLEAATQLDVLYR